MINKYLNLLLHISPALAFVPASISKKSSWTSYGFMSALSLHRHDENIEDLEDGFAALVITESDWKGAGLLREDLDPEDLPTLLMEALSLNDFPQIDSGLMSMWAFAGETTRFIFQRNETEFIGSAHKTANEFPTSFYGNSLYGKSWKMLTPVTRVGGEDGWICTQLMSTMSCDGRLRRWQWELRKNRRPPNLNCWFVESIGSSDRKGEFEPE